MKAKNILMTLLLVTGAIAAKAAGYPPELALVSQPVMVYNYNSVTVYYDVENIGDYTYRGSVYLFLDPDDGYVYAKKSVSVCPGRIKRIALEIPAYRANPGWVYTIMPYYKVGNELYSFTTFEYFEPLEFWWNGPRSYHYIVVSVPPRPRHYTRPNPYRFYYDGYRPPMPPPNGHGPGTPSPPMDPKHHTYNYHHNNGGYPANHNVEPKPNNDGGTPAPNATVRPKTNGGSMSSGNSHSGNNGNPPAPPANNLGTSSVRPGNNDGAGSNSGRVNSGATTSPATGNTNGASNSGRTGNSGNTRVNNGSNSTNSNSGRVNNGTTTRPSSGSTRPNGNVNNSSNTRNSNGSSSTRSNGNVNSSSNNRNSNGSSSTRNSGSGSSNTRGNSSRGGR